MEPPLAPSRSPLIRVSTIAPLARNTVLTDVSLSRFFPAGTAYFYGYPAGDDSQFYNTDPPFVDELVAARALTCAGPSVTPIVFSVSKNSATENILRNELGWMRSSLDHIALPHAINHRITGNERNRLIKAALTNRITSGRLIMAQPYLDEGIRSLFSLPPTLSIWLNDKKNLPHYIPSTFLPERYAEFPDGGSFARSSIVILLPCVVKVSSSCCGDGVRICETAAQLEQARREFGSIHSTIIVEERIDLTRSFSIQFGIPSNPTQEIELIGVSEQLTTPEGAYIGGIVDPSKLTARIDGINDLLLTQILPTVRELGWYGIGGIDILVDRQERFFVVDPNFRMTGMTPFLCDARNGKVKKCMASFVGTFKGDTVTFLRVLGHLAREGSPAQRIHIIALTQHDRTFRMSAALLFEHDEQHLVPSYAGELLALGLESRALKKLSKNERKSYPDFPGKEV